MLWGIKNLEELGTGHWPDDPDKSKSGYDIEYKGKILRYGNADFTLACGIAGEIGARLKLAGKKADYLTTWVHNYYPNEGFEELARLNGMYVEDMARLIRRVLRFISGEERKG